jgi:hypothetical protein
LFASIKAICYLLQLLELTSKLSHMTIPNFRFKFFVGVFASLFAIGASCLFFDSYAPLWVLLIVVPIALIGLVDVLQKKQAIRRNYPLLGRLRYLMETLRPAIQQYFVESDLNGRPFSRRKRSLVYQRAKKSKRNGSFWNTSRCIRRRVRMDDSFVLSFR